MEIFLINSGQASHLTESPERLPENGFLWIDATHEELMADSAAWREKIEQITGVHIFDLHLADAVNLAHPSYFDSTQDYAMLVFRKLALSTDGASELPIMARKIPPALTKLATKPVTFLLMQRALVTVHAANSRTIETTRSRLLEAKPRREGGNSPRAPASPEELMLRLLNAMVDQFLELRQPLTGQIDRWQRALLNPRNAFNDWTALLDARIELRKLDRLCEGQHDAIQELRDYVVDDEDEDSGNGRARDLLLVRINDVMEHIVRVLNHTRRLESSIESAVQIHFSAMAHRTSEIMRTLTVITALFMPLTLVTGIFGMNFADMPLLNAKDGFWITLGMMAIIVATLLFFFRRKRYFDDQSMENDR